MGRAYLGDNSNSGRTLVKKNFFQTFNQKCDLLITDIERRRDSDRMSMTVVYNDAQAHQLAAEFHGIAIFYFNADEEPLAPDFFNMLRAGGDFDDLLL